MKKSKSCNKGSKAEIALKTKQTNDRLLKKRHFCPGCNEMKNDIELAFSFDRAICRQCASLIEYDFKK